MRVDDDEVQFLREGDPGALVRLWSLHRPGVRDALLREGLEARDADRLVNEVFVAVIDARESIDATRAFEPILREFVTWVARAHRAKTAAPLDESASGEPPLRAAPRG